MGGRKAVLLSSLVTRMGRGVCGLLAQGCGRWDMIPVDCLFFVVITMDARKSFALLDRYRRSLYHWPCSLASISRTIVGRSALHRFRKHVQSRCVCL